MPLSIIRVALSMLLVTSFTSTFCNAAPAKRQTPAQIAQTKTISRSVRAHMTVLASDKFKGRGSATNDELVAARFIAGELKRYGVQPAGEKKTFLQRISVSSQLGLGRTTTNVVGILRGSDKTLSKQTILLSAHLDHLGVGPAVNGDAIYNGADDDASGVCAVLQLARILASGPRPKRTIVFALFGSEEIGGFGALGFRERPPVPLRSIVANLEFEMIGRPDPAAPPGTLWLTGYERSDLGAALASHGARLVADPHPEQLFFQRSDNYVLAKRGVVAHTVSSFGLHSDYHQPSDDIAGIDFAHLSNSIASMVAPVRWLCNSNFVPRWKAGQRP